MRTSFVAKGLGVMAVLSMTFVGMSAIGPGPKPPEKRGQPGPQKGSVQPMAPLDKQVAREASGLGRESLHRRNLDEGVALVFVNRDVDGAQASATPGKAATLDGAELRCSEGAADLFRVCRGHGPPQAALRVEVRAPGCELVLKPPMRPDESFVLLTEVSEGAAKTLPMRVEGARTGDRSVSLPSSPGWHALGVSVADLEKGADAQLRAHIPLNTTGTLKVGLIGAPQPGCRLSPMYSARLGGVETLSEASPAIPMCWKGPSGKECTPKVASLAALIRHFAEADPKDPELAWLSGQVLFQEKRMEEATVAAERAQTLSLQRAEARTKGAAIIADAEASPEAVLAALAGPALRCEDYARLTRPKSADWQPVHLRLEVLRARLCPSEGR